MRDCVMLLAAKLSLVQDPIVRFFLALPEGEQQQKQLMRIIAWGSKPIASGLCNGLP